MTSATKPCHATILEPIFTVAVSPMGAQARGRAKKYPYFGCGVYRPERRRDGVWTWRCVVRATSAWRSWALCQRYAEELRASYEASEEERVSGLEPRHGHAAPVRDPWQCI